MLPNESRLFGLKDFLIVREDSENGPKIHESPMKWRASQQVGIYF